MAEIIRMTRRVRPLRKTYKPDAPYVVERIDHDDNEITYEVMDERPDSYRMVCVTSDDHGRNPYAKHDAESVARGLNLLVAYKMERLPNIRNTDDMDIEDDDDAFD